MSKSGLAGFTIVHLSDWVFRKSDHSIPLEPKMRIVGNLDMLKWINSPELLKGGLFQILFRQDRIYYIV